MEIVIGDIYDNLASERPAELLQGTFVCGFCHFEVTSDEDLVDCKEAQAHAAAHRLAFETLLEHKAFPSCPICENIIVSDKLLSTKSGQVLFNDLDVVEHLEQHHFESLLEDFINDFDQPSYLQTTFVQREPESIKQTSLLHTSFVNCDLCGWTTADLQLETVASLTQEVSSHLYSHLEEDDFIIGYEEAEENILKKAELGALKRSLPLTGNIDLSSIPYADKLAILYPKQLIKLFGPTVVIVIRCLHGLRPNPFIKAAIQNGFDERIKMLKSKGGSCLIAQGLQGLAENLSSDEVLPDRESRERKYECGREECGHAEVDFGNSIKTISHLLAHVRFEESRLSHITESLTPSICRCGVQSFSPMGLFYHINNAHFFEEEEIEADSIVAKVIAKADMVVNAFGQSCFRGRQRPRHQIVLMELQSRIVLQEGPGEEKDWPLLEDPINERWLLGWEKFLNGSLHQQKLVEFLCSTPFEDLIFYDGTASILFPDASPKKTFSKAHQHFLRFFGKSRNSFPKLGTQNPLEAAFLRHYRLNMRRKRERRLRLAQKANAFKVSFDVSHLTKLQLGNYLGIRNQTLVDQGQNGEVLSSDSESEESSENEEKKVVGSGKVNNSHTRSKDSILMVNELPPKTKKMNTLLMMGYEDEDNEIDYDDTRLYCRICPNTSFVPSNETAIQTHAAAHAVLLLGLSSSADFHSDGIYSCPVCPYEPSSSCRASDFDIASTIRHLMGRHAHAITPIYEDYLQKKYPTTMFTQKFSSLSEAETDPSHGSLMFRCKRTGVCKMPELIGNTLANRGFLCRLDTDLQILKHLLFHIRVDKGIDLEPQDREILTRCLMARMSSLSEKNLAIHISKVIAKYDTDSQGLAMKFILAKLKSIVMAIFELDAPWVLKLVFPISSLRLHLSQVFLHAYCQKCTRNRLDYKTKQAVSFIVDPTSAALHAVNHRGDVLDNKKTTTQFDCPICGEMMLGEEEIISHLLSSHPICINTGLLFPLLSSLSLAKNFTEIIGKFFGSQAWQLELAAGFPSQQPKHCNQLTQSLPTTGKAFAVRKRAGVEQESATKSPKISDGVSMTREPTTIAEALSRLA